MSAQWMPEKIKIEKFKKKISKGTNNVRIPHILHTLTTLLFFEVKNKNKIKIGLQIGFILCK